MRYQDAAEWIDRQQASPWFLAAFLTVVTALALVSIDASNFFISIVTATSVLLTAGGLRRMWAAAMAKLDALVDATPGACNELVRAEERDEAEIEGLRL